MAPAPAAAAAPQRLAEVSSGYGVVCAHVYEAPAHPPYDPPQIRPKPAEGDASQRSVGT